MAITAAMVKELREKTGAGMMDCQRALAEAGGDMEEAVKSCVRRSGGRRQEGWRVAKDGLVAVAVAADGSRGALVELNCETDFVARTERYQAFAQALAEQAMTEGWADAAAGLQRPLAADPAHTVAQAIAGQIATIGENIVLARAASLVAAAGSKVGSYLHMGGKIGVLVEITAGAGDDTVRDVAMHVAAAEPRFTSREVVPQPVIDEELEIGRAQAQAMGKPPQVADKIAEGKLAKFFELACLIEQPFVRNPEQTVGAMLAARGGATVGHFLRYSSARARRQARSERHPAVPARRPQALGEVADGEPAVRHRRRDPAGACRRDLGGARAGVEVSVVIGGGNIIRGIAATQQGLDRVTVTTWGCWRR